MQGQGREIDTLSVRRPQPHTTSLYRGKEEKGKIVEGKKGESKYKPTKRHWTCSWNPPIPHRRILGQPDRSREILEAKSTLPPTASDSFFWATFLRTNITIYWTTFVVLFVLELLSKTNDSSLMKFCVAFFPAVALSCQWRGFLSLFGALLSLKMTWRTDGAARANCMNSFSAQTI